MSDPSPAQSPLWLIPALPLAAAVTIGLLGPRLLRRHSHWLCILAIAGAFVVSFGAFREVRDASGHVHEAHSQPVFVGNYFDWLQAGPIMTADKVRTGRHMFEAPFSLRADALSTMMACMVTFVGTLIAIFASGYMDGDPGYPRFFAAVSLFVVAMILLVLGDNFLVLFLGWEGVGLCSYLLIGFWFAKPSAAAAARKAFLVTRIGDLGLILGILLIWVTFDYHIDYTYVFSHVEGHSQGILLAVCLLLFCGAVGKSAQFPLHVWLPDAMEGPTPVSALIHAATMVTAGVYLVARCTPLYSAVPEAQLTVGCIGGFTAFLAALIALTQNDLKRVLAYSTLSQLGYMFLALGCAIGGTSLTTFAVIAGLFHLFTHAFFKALLFLSAGSVMHAMGGIIDIRRFSGLRKVLPHTHWTFLCGALALAGFPFLSGFWSKDEILGAAFEAGKASPKYATTYTLLFLVGMVTAALTAFYTFRVYFKTFWGELKVPPEAGSHGHGAADHGHGHGHGHAHDHGHGHGNAHAAPHAAGPGVAHESPPVMTVPLMILAVFAVGVGYVLGPLTHGFEHFLEHAPAFSSEPAKYDHLLLMVISSLLALSGIGVAWLMYVKQPELPGKLASSAQALYQLSLNKFHFDELYDYLIIQPLEGFATFCRIFDTYVVDGLVDLVGYVFRGIGWLFRPIQNGLVQFYALAMVLGLTVFVLAFIRSL